jgi:glycosyltransferase involved in cell wall biosynthesis
MTVSEFIGKLRNEKDVVLYGAGSVGKIIQEYLCYEKIDVRAFVVTSAVEKGKINGMPVYGLDEIFDLYPDAFVVVSVMKLTQPDLEKNLNDRGIMNYLVLSEALIYEMRNKVFAIRAAEKGREQDLKPYEDNTVGYVYPGYMDTDYAEKRLIIGKLSDKKYIRIPKEIADFRCIGTKYEDNVDAYRMLVEACYCPKYFEPKVSYIHTFNMVCRTQLPWCVSFETSIPRVYGDNIEYKKKLIDYMEKPNCCAMFALSKNAYDIQKRNLEGVLTADEADRLMAKTKVLHAPQPLLVSEEDIANRDCEPKNINFIFIGRAFFIKGGKAVIDVLSRYEGKYDFKLTLISSLQYDDYFTSTPYDEMIKYKNIISHKSWIEYYESLPNETVLEKCRQSSIGLLPSVSETYGYALLEMQAAGLPVVSTNIRAFPELNNNTCGWVCNIPIDEEGCCSERNMTKLYMILESELVRVFDDIFSNPKQIKEKGLKSWNRVKEMHDPVKYANVIDKAMR